MNLIVQILERYKAFRADRMAAKAHREFQKFMVRDLYMTKRLAEENKRRFSKPHDNQP